jgi:uncharacterized protein (TIGR02599 family)
MKAISSRTHSGRKAVIAPPRSLQQPSPTGFTLVELLLSMTILSVLMLVVVNVIGVVQQQWIRSNSRVTAFRETRMAMDILAKNLSQATLNPYWMTQSDPLTPDALNQKRFAALDYVRQSELQFCSGRTTGLVGEAAGQVTKFPGHAVFFQAPLGTARLTRSTGSQVNTENMVNLLCARGYFVSWGDDAAFRPPFLSGDPRVKPRFRYRLMEFSPTAESNRIYYDPLYATDISGRRPITDPSRSREWFSDAKRNPANNAEDASSRGFTRPVADNIIALVFSPQLARTVAGGSPEDIAPLYDYDSVLTSNPGAATPSSGTQGTQHLLPPLIKVTMVALDGAAGEKLAESGNEDQQRRIADTLAPLFTNARGYNNPTSSYNQDLSKLQQTLVQEKLNFRVFTTTVVMKQSRWSTSQ